MPFHNRQLKFSSTASSTADDIDSFVNRTSTPQTTKRKPLFMAIDALKELGTKAKETGKSILKRETKFQKFFIPTEEFKDVTKAGNLKAGKETGTLSIPGPGGKPAFVDPFQQLATIRKVAKPIIQKAAKPVFEGFTDITTSILNKLKGKSATSKQEILDLTNSPEVRQVEREIFREELADAPKKVNVQEIADRIKTRLLPLETTGPKFSRVTDAFEASSPRYESIALPDNLRGNIANYYENIYQSPIKNSAADVHFNGEGIDNYFAHTRVEDLAPRQGTFQSAIIGAADGRIGDTRRVIEIQSDLFQKGGLETAASQHGTFGEVQNIGKELNIDIRQAAKELTKRRSKEIQQLQPYRNTWYERITREEIKKAAQDGKTKLQFPTGETAMKIEGLGADYSDTWKIVTQQGDRVGLLSPNTMKKGMEITDASGNNWIITDVFEFGKFNAVPKPQLELIAQANNDTVENLIEEGIKKGLLDDISNFTEQFDISGKIDTSNPIYKFYEKQVQKFLRKFNGKKITDPQGVEWIEVPINKEMAKEPVQAFGKAPLKTILGGAAATGAAIGIGNVIPDKVSFERKEGKKKQEIFVSQPVEVKDRGVNVTSKDFTEEFEPIAFGEVSNRSPEKQELEIRVILNTALNRMRAYKEKGIDKTLIEILTQPNQYQAYKGKEYIKYKKKSIEAGGNAKKQKVKNIVDNIFEEIQEGTFKDNTNGAFYYIHNDDGSITYDDTRPLFK